MLVEREVILPVPPMRAWKVLTDWERQSLWMLDADEVAVVSPDREGVGVRLAVRTRLFGIPAFTEPLEVSAWDPPARLAIRHGALVAGTGTWELEPVDAGTRFRWGEAVSLELPVVGGIVGLCYRPILRWLMGRAQRRLRALVIASGPASDRPSATVPRRGSPARPG